MLMSIKKRKIISFIPVINLLSLLFMLKEPPKKPIKISYTLVDIAKAFLAILFVIAVRLFLMYVFKNDILDKILLVLFLHFCISIACWLEVKRYERGLSNE